ncbi:uncharacterized protein ACA1_365050 [Acanthamoeba castellanii str. Neff]|uniref:Uncharacterized protein n=1 Tax=Acanthamoeba castellanii (strain ATCC 30010 / Neff) TaxID=1257118 RepID=L8GLP9_ACACF|nr:uncharacterized protein ACA1_365050 [Acanthamoeba castellanii str. Neff]ELR13957.1 hypothetical protein ACA1_365050 [Acanthamoeba castellanii str. Neff]
MDFLRLVGEVRDKLVVRTAKDDDRRGFTSSPPCSAVAASQNVSNALDRVPWNWVCLNLVSLLERYPSGVTMAIVLSDLQNLWDETSIEWRYGISRRLESIDKIKATKKVGLTAILEASIAEAKQTPGTQTSAGRAQQEKIEWYLHQKFYPLVAKGLFTERRTLRLTGCQLVVRDLRLLPTEFAVLVLTDSDRAYIRTKFVDSLRTITLDRDPRATEPIDLQREYHIFVKVHSISSQKAQEFMHRTETRVAIKDSSHGSPFTTSSSSTTSNLSMTATDATFTLWDDQTKLATLFKEGDYLAISNPKFPLAGAWKDKRTLEYGPQTIVHVLPMAPSQDLVSSSTSPYALTPTPTQFRVPKDEKGNRDLRHFPEPVAFQDLRANMVNVSLFGRIIRMGKNAPFVRPGLPSVARYPLVLQSVETNEEAGGEEAAGYSRSVTLWDNLVSTLPGWLMSPDLYTTVSLEGGAKLTNFICRATIVGWTPFLSTHLVLYTAHSRCKRQVVQIEEKGQEGKTEIQCEFCGVSCKPDAGVCPAELAYEIYWKLEDSTGELKVLATPQVNQAIMQMAPQEFAKMPSQHQTAKLNSILGQEFVFSFKEGPRRQLRRIDQIAPPNVVAESRKLLLSSTH